MNDETARDAGYDDFLDALQADEGYYLACANDHAWLPPRRVCPACGETELTEQPLPSPGTITVASAVHVAAPQFADDVPYVVALAEFGPVTLTGQLQTVEDTEGLHDKKVEPGIATRESDGERLVAFSLLEE